MCVLCFFFLRFLNLLFGVARYRWYFVTFGCVLFARARYFFFAVCVHTFKQFMPLVCESRNSWHCANARKHKSKMYWAIQDENNRKKYITQTEKSCARREWAYTTIYPSWKLVIIVTQCSARAIHAIINIMIISEREKKTDKKCAPLLLLLWFIFVVVFCCFWAAMDSVCFFFRFVFFGWMKQRFFFKVYIVKHVLLCVSNEKVPYKMLKHVTICRTLNTKCPCCMCVCDCSLHYFAHFT